MAININGISNTQTTSANESGQAAPTHSAPSKIQAETGTSTAKDTVSLTEVAKQLQQVERQLNAQPVVDIQRVEATRQAVNQGEYSINADRVASKFVQLESLLQAG